MDPALNTGLGIAGAVMTLFFSAVGSGLGTGVAGSAAVGAWKKCYIQGKQAPFLLLTYVGAPLTQTLYGMIVMFTMIGRAVQGSPWIPLFVIGIIVDSVFGVADRQIRRYWGLVDGDRE